MICRSPEIKECPTCGSLTTDGDSGVKLDIQNAIYELHRVLRQSDAELVCIQIRDSAGCPQRFHWTRGMRIENLAVGSG